MRFISFRLRSQRWPHRILPRFQRSGRKPCRGTHASELWLPESRRGSNPFGLVAFRRCSYRSLDEGEEKEEFGGVACFFNGSDRVLLCPTGDLNRVERSAIGVPEVGFVELEGFSLIHRGIIRLSRGQRGV